MQPFESILVDIDATARAHPELERAVRIARGAGARLKIVDIITVPFDARRYVQADLVRDMTNRRGQLSRIASAITGVTVDWSVLQGPPAPALIRDVLRFGHDLLIRSHTRDLVAPAARPFCAVDIQLFRDCPCPVWAVGPGAAPQSPRVVGAVHANVENARAREMDAKIIELALSIVDLERGTLILLHAWRPYAEGIVLSHSSSEEFSAYLCAVESRTTQTLRDLKNSFGEYLAGVQVELYKGDPEEVIPEFVVSQGVDLVVVGTAARRGIAGLLIGNTAERLLQRLPCSVLAVKPDGFVSPVRLEERAWAGTTLPG
jgi:universal stress protein E